MELDPSTTAIIAVHYQADIVGPDGAFAGFFREQVEARNVLAVTADLLAAARGAGATVVYTRVAWRADHADLVPNSPLLGIVAQSGCLTEGTAGAEIVAEVAPQDGDLIVTHQRPGGFVASQLDTLLRSRGITTVLFTGVATNASVEGTARGASDLGYRTLLVEDACSAATQAAHDASIESMGLLAEITTTAEVTAALGATVAARA